MSGGALGGRDADEAKPGGNARAEPLDDKGGGRPGAEPDDHAVLDLLDRAHSRRALQLVAIEHHGWGRAASSTNQVSSPTGRTRAAGSA